MARPSLTASASLRLESPVGVLLVEASSRGLRALQLGASGGCAYGASAAAACCAGREVLAACAAQLEQYFRGRRERFELPLDLAGTPFQLRAWAALQQIPFGETRSYAQQAALIGAPTATRAVGAANARNPIQIVVPCHRVVGAGGSLTGFAGGVSRKRALLELEGAWPLARS